MSLDENQNSCQVKPTQQVLTDDFITIEEAKTLLQESISDFINSDSDDPQLRNIINSSAPDALIETLEHAPNIHGVDLTNYTLGPDSLDYIENVATPAQTIRAILEAGYDTMQEYNLPSPNLDIYERTGILMATDNLDHGAALGQARMDMLSSGEMSLSGNIYTYDNTSENYSTLEKPSFDFGNHDQYLSEDGIYCTVGEAPFQTEARTVGVRGNLGATFLGGGEVSGEVSYDFENHEIEIELTPEMCLGSRVDTGIEIFSKPSTSDGTSLSVTPKATGSFGAQVQTPIGPKVGGDVKIETGTELSTSNGITPVLDYEVDASFGHLHINTSEEVSILSSGAKIGAAACLEAPAKLTLSVSDAYDWARGNPDQSIVEELMEDYDSSPF